jgi:ribokinase
MPPFDVVILGSYNQDHVWTAPTFPETGESRLGTYSSGPGGKGFNQAVACHRQQIRTLFLGALGDDALADIARRTAAGFELPVDFETRTDAATGSAGIVVDAAGNNRIVVAPGANQHLSVDFVRAHAAHISAAKVLVCQLESNLESTQEAMRIAHAGGTTVILNPAPINRGLGAQLASFAHILTPNETEFAFVLEHVHGQPLASRYFEFPDPMLHSLCRKLAAPTVVITLGERGCFVSHANPIAHADGNAFYRVPAAPAQTIDTVGAGDAFTGGLAAGMILYGMAKPFRDAVIHATRVAALSTERPGAAASMPTRREVAARFGT